MLKQNLTFNSESRIQYFAFTFWNKCRIFFSFLLEDFNRYAVIFCSHTETEIYRNRKFDPETEISASESDFRFCLCSTPTQN